MAAIKVVLVEDERIVALNLRQRLLKLGYEVAAIATSAEQALFFVGRENPDLVLMDIHIDGGVDGIDTAQQLIDLYRVPIIYLTAYSEESTLERARATKPYGYLLKPFSERDLHATLQMALERRRAEQALAKSEARLRLALDAASMGAWELDLDTQRMVYSGDANHIFGFSGMAFSDSLEALLTTVHAADRELVGTALRNAAVDGLADQIEFRSHRADGSVRWLCLQGKMFSGLAGAEGRHVIGVVQDITEHRVMDQQLREAAAVFEATQDGILILDEERRVVAANASFEAITGHAGNELLGTEPYLLQSNVQRQKNFHELEASVEAGERWRGEIRSRRSDGTELPLLLTVVPVKNDASVVSRYVLTTTDLTDVRKVEERLQYLAHHDPLTDLPNRLLTTERLAHALKRGKRRNERIALFFIDLDRFKWVNDTLGHGAGDTLLAEIAQRMKDCVREDDTIGRFGGDEFLVILDPMERLKDIAQVADKIIERVSAPVLLAGQEVVISCSIGISLFPEDGTTPEYLIRAADTAMYAAKEGGRDRYEFYAQTMNAKAQRQIANGRDLRRGFAADELVLHYQPQISLRDRAVIGVEALVRWQHSRQGLLGARDVIGVAKENGLLADIGEWVLRNACQQVVQWRDMGLQAPRVAVNVTATQMHSPRFIDALEQILDETGVSPAQLEIEITETTLQSGNGCQASLTALRRLGVSLALDDFGSGYSCLSALQNSPVQRIKLDRSCVSTLPENRGGIAIAEAIIAMAHRLDLHVMAEGIETSEQERILRDRGCDEAQGFLYAKPMSATAISGLLAGR
jgi:diguanylate cyclase (GGDEF)-like protein/PAS domain S-box-containing protein